jgi:Polyketide cyclase / dehydrase and lipid transport
MSDPEIAQGTNRSFHHDEKAAAPAAALWDRWMDVATWGDWDLGLKSASATEPLALGSTGQLIPKSGPRTTFTVVEFAPGKAYAFSTKMPGGELVVRRILTTSTHTDVEFRHEVRFDGPMAWLWSALYGKKFRRALPPTMRGLAALVAKPR